LNKNGLPLAPHFVASAFSTACSAGVLQGHGVGHGQHSFHVPLHWAGAIHDAGAVILLRWPGAKHKRGRHHAAELCLARIRVHPVVHCDFFAGIWQFRLWPDRGPAHVFLLGQSPYPRTDLR